MRMKTISLTLIALVLTATATAQPPASNNKLPGGAAGKPATAAPDSLEALIAAALKSNPDIQVAEAKVREAEAGLNKARITVMQQVASAQASLQAAKADLAGAESKLKRLQKLWEQRIEAVNLQEPEHDVERAKAVVARAEADLNLILGKPFK